MSGQQAGAGGSAVGGVGIGVGEDHTLAGQLVDAGGLVELASHEADVLPAHVVDEDEDEVWFFWIF